MLCSQSRRSVLMNEAHSADLEVRNGRRLAVAAPAAHLALERPPAVCTDHAACGRRRRSLVTTVPLADSSPGRRRRGPGCNKYSSRLLGIPFWRRQQQRLPWRLLLAPLLLLRRCIVWWGRPTVACVSCLGGALADRHPCKGVLFAAGLRGSGAGRSLMPCTRKPG